MAVHAAEAGVAGQPVANEGDAFLGVAVLVADMGEGVRDRPVVSIGGDGAFDDAATLGKTPGLRDGHPVMRAEPPVVAVRRRKRVEIVRQFLHAPGAAGDADQADLVGRGRQHHRVGRPTVGMGAHGGQGVGLLAIDQQAEDADMARFPLARGAGFRLGDGVPRGGKLAAEL